MKIEIKELLLSEINRRKEKAIKELETIQEAKRNVSVADKRKYKALQSKIRSLQKELSTVEKRYSNIIEVQREQIEMLGGNDEEKPQTEILEVSDEPCEELVDLMSYEPCKEGVEIKHLKFTNHYNKPISYHLLKEHGELFIDE